MPTVVMELILFVNAGARSGAHDHWQQHTRWWLPSWYVAGLKDVIAGACKAFDLLIRFRAMSEYMHKRDKHVGRTVRWADVSLSVCTYSQAVRDAGELAANAGFTVV